MAEKADAEVDVDEYPTATAVLQKEMISHAAQYIDQMMSARFPGAHAQACPRSLKLCAMQLTMCCVVCLLDDKGYWGIEFEDFVPYQTACRIAGR